MRRYKIFNIFQFRLRKSTYKWGNKWEGKRFLKIFYKIGGVKCHISEQISEGIWKILKFLQIRLRKSTTQWLNKWNGIKDFNLLSKNDTQSEEKSNRNEKVKKLKIFFENRNFFWISSAVINRGKILT